MPLEVIFLRQAPWQGRPSVCAFNDDEPFHHLYVPEEIMTKKIHGKTEETRAATME